MVILVHDNSVQCQTKEQTHYSQDLIYLWMGIMGFLSQRVQITFLRAREGRVSEKGRKNRSTV